MDMKSSILVTFFVVCLSYRNDAKRLPNDISEEILKIEIQLKEITKQSALLLEQNINLQKDISKLKSDKKDLQRDLSGIKSTNNGLQKEISVLKLNGYGNFNVEDLQWQSLHMAAAAACRASTVGGGKGRRPNRVFAASLKESCRTVCGKSDYKNCDSQVSIMGFMGRARSSNEEVGWFYNYSCDEAAQWYGSEPERTFSISKTSARDRSATYVSYCCCRL